MKTVLCPTCDKRIVWDKTSEWRPFCSERCKLIDLGEWAKESYRLPDENSPGGTNLDDQDYDESV